MARSSPGVHRVAAILNFMADHPGKSFALTDLIRALKLSRATCHSLLTGLVEVGYLYRTSDKSYVLGPGLAKIAQAANGHSSPLQVAQPEMRMLADTHDVVCSAFFLEGDTVAVRERAASVSHVGFSVPAGTRLKLRAPFAAPFLAWSSPDEVGSWLAGASIEPTDEERESLEASMRFARGHAFVAFVLRSRMVDSERGLEHVFGSQSTEFPMIPATEFDPDKEYCLTALLAPVFDAGGRVAFVMGLMSFNRLMHGKDVFALAARLTDACRRITGFIGGRDPSAHAL